MFPQLTSGAANLILAATCLPSHRAWRRAGRSRHHVADAQHRLLTDIVAPSAETQFGREHGFEQVRTIDEFRRSVRLSDYEAYADHIAAIADGTPKVLTPDDVELLQPSSGSTGASKLIPYTARLREEFMRGVKPWLADLFLHRPSLMLGKSYWAVTPAGNRPDDDSGGVAVGFEEDSAYFGRLEQRLLRRILAVPDEVAAIGDMDVFQYVTLLCLLSEQNLRLISVWNPTFLTLLLGRLDDWAKSLLSDIRSGQINPPGELDPLVRRAVARQLRGNPRRADVLANEWRRRAAPADLEGIGPAIWPRLRLLSCWADGAAKRCLPTLERIFPGVEIQPKGLMATEGIVSFPLIGHEGGPLAIRSHFFEFIEQTKLGEEGPIRLAHELVAGQKYSVVITTGGGLYRYRLRDVVRVEGFKRGLPLIRFLQKEDCVSDMVGEKLNATHVDQVLTSAWQRHHLTPQFYMMAPEHVASPECSYVLFVQCPAIVTDATLQTVAGEVERQLCENFHYNHCRKLGQLSPVRVYRIDPTEEFPMEKCLSRRTRAGNKSSTIKPSILQPDDNWTALFRGRFLDGNGSERGVSPT